MKLFFQEYSRVYRQIINDVNRILRPYNLTSVLWGIILYISRNGTAKASHIYEYYSLCQSLFKKLFTLILIRLIALSIDLLSLSKISAISL